MRDVTPDKLAAALRAGLAADDWERHAAIDLLAAHDYWLRTGLVRGAVRWQSAQVAHLLWSQLAAGVDDSRASGSERAILRLACSLSGAIPAGMDGLQALRWTVQTIFRPLDDANARLALSAITYAATGQGVIA